MTIIKDGLIPFIPSVPFDSDPWDIRRAKRNSPPWGDINPNIDIFKKLLAGTIATVKHTDFDMIETDDSYEIVGDVPGVKEEDLSISFHNGVIDVEVKRDIEKTKGKAIYAERRTLNFKRSFSVPETDNECQISATMRNGVLTILVNKKIKAKPRKIQIGRDNP